VVHDNLENNKTVPFFLNYLLVLSYPPEKRYPALLFSKAKFQAVIYIYIN